MCVYNESLSHGQQDAQEAFLALLHSLNNVEIRKRKNAVLQKFQCDKKSIKSMSLEQKEEIVEFVNLARNTTFLDKLFRGSTLTQITCLTCKSSSRSVDIFYGLSLPLIKKKPRQNASSNDEQKISKHQKKKQTQQQRKKVKKSKKCEIKNGVEDGNIKSGESQRENGDIQSNENMDEGSNYFANEDQSLTCDDVDEALTAMPTVEVQDVSFEIESDVDETLQVEEVTDNKERVLGGRIGLVESDAENDDGGMFHGLFDGNEEGTSGNVEGASGNEAEAVVENGNDTIDESISILTSKISEMDIGDGDTLNGCFHQFCKEDILCGENQFLCYNCGKKQSSFSNGTSSNGTIDTEDEVAIEAEGDETDNKKDEIKPVLRDAHISSCLRSLPPILVLHLKRFTQDAKGHLIKDRRKIQYPLELNLEQFSSGEVDQDYTYKLYGVVDHSGSLHRGHYTAYVRKRQTSYDSQVFNSHSFDIEKFLKESDVSIPPSEKWYFCNDERIMEVNVKKVLNADAYLLFYERIFANP